MLFACCVKPIPAVGDKARVSLNNIGIEVVASIRHPANGGATKFNEGLAQVLQVRM